MRAYGDTDTEKRLIRINVKKSKKSGNRGEVLNTIIHETEHAKHPRLGERQTYKRTARLEKRLSRRKKQKYYNLIK